MAQKFFYLHSNMVRFIISDANVGYAKDPNLHSNMVRFIIDLGEYVLCKLDLFTFQYG